MAYTLSQTCSECLTLSYLGKISTWVGLGSNGKSLGLIAEKILLAIKLAQNVE